MRLICNVCGHSWEEPNWDRPSIEGCPQCAQRKLCAECGTEAEPWRSTCIRCGKMEFRYVPKDQG